MMQSQRADPHLAPQNLFSDRSEPQDVTEKQSRRDPTHSAAVTARAPLLTRGEHSATCRTRKLLGARSLGTCPRDPIITR